MGWYEEEERSFFEKHRVIVGCGLVVAIAIAVWFGHNVLEQTTRARQENNVVFVSLPPTPPPAPRPPPPSRLPPPPTESEQKMIEQVPISDMESKPDETSKAESSAGEAPGLGTSIQGDGSADAFGLRAGNGFSGIIGGTGKNASRGSGSRWGWYASQVQHTISQALEGNNHTRNADFRVVARIWSDRTGRITRARLASSTGDGALDNAITNEVLAGLVLQEPPPDGMPMPIVLRLVARHSQVALSR